MEFRWKLGILLSLPIITFQISHPSSLSYIGGVVEYHPVTQIINNENPVDLNAKNYVKFIKKAAEYNVDILIFPELSLSVSTSADPKIARSEGTSYVPDPKDKMVLCDNDTYAFSLRTISCAARDHRMYVVVNHREKVDCLGNTTGCPSDNLLIYNTNVAFDRQGRVIARYRKFNLFYEPGVNVTDSGVVSTFRTDFGVTFGQFICADIMFLQPALNLTQQLGIRDIIFPSLWFSELPFLFSVQVHAGWAYTNDVNLLSSGGNNPSNRNSGTGIFIGRKGYSDVVLETKPSNVLVVSEIPKVIKGKRPLDIDRRNSHVYRFSDSEIDTTRTSVSLPYVPFVDELSIHTTKPIDLKLREHEAIMCNRGLCCDFKFRTSFDQSMIKDGQQHYKYRMAVFNGTRFLSRGVGLQSCGIISCTNDTLSGCGRLFDPNVAISSPTTFHSVEITMRNVREGNHQFIPGGLLRNLRPMNVTDYVFEVENLREWSIIRMVLKKDRNDLLTFAILGRNFDADDSEITKNS